MNVIFDLFGHILYIFIIGYVCPSYFNPADFFLDLVSVDTRSKMAQIKSKSRIDFLVEEYRKDWQNKKIKKYSFNEYNEKLANKTKDIQREQSKKSVKVSAIEQLNTLSTRSFKQMARDRRSLIIRIIMNIFFAFFISAVYSSTNGNYSQESIIDREGVLFFMCILQSMGPIINTVQGFCLEKSIVMRERENRSYSLGIYYITTFIATSPLQLLFPVIFGCILYWIVGLRNNAMAFLYFLIITVLQNFASIGLGFLCGAGAPAVEAATTIGQTLVALMILFSGFFIHVNSLPHGLRWLTWISTIRWSFMAFCINEFTDEEFDDCDTEEEQAAGCIPDGAAVIKKFDFDGYSVEFGIMMLGILLVSFHILAFATLKLSKVKYYEVKQHSNISQTYEMSNMKK